MSTETPKSESWWRSGSLREPLVMHLAAQQRSRKDHRRPVDVPWVAEAIRRIVDAEEAGGAT